MIEENDVLSFLDRLELQFVFFPRRDLNPEPSMSGARNYFIEVAEGIRIGCRFYAKSSNFPYFLYFHGNGEIVSDHDWLAPFYHQRGINLFVADYRGYGFSDGNPTIGNVIRDSHPIFKEIIKKKTVRRDSLSWVVP